MIAVCLAGPTKGRTEVRLVLKFSLANDMVFQLVKRGDRSARVLPDVEAT
jgi:hypothetical protein